jgi:hypothetical protein
MQALRSAGSQQAQLHAELADAHACWLPYAEHLEAQMRALHTEVAAVAAAMAAMVSVSSTPVASHAAARMDGRTVPGRFPCLALWEFV